MMSFSRSLSLVLGLYSYFDKVYMLIWCLVFQKAYFTHTSVIIKPTCDFHYLPLYAKPYKLNSKLVIHLSLYGNVKINDLEVNAILLCNDYL